MPQPSRESRFESKSAERALAVWSRDLVVRILDEPAWLICPGFADGFVRREPLERLQAVPKVVGLDEVGEVLPKLIMALVVEALDGRVLDGPVHPLDLTVRPRMARLGQTMFDVEIGAGRLEGVATEEHLLGAHDLDLRRRPGVAGRLGEVGAVVGEHGVDLVGNRGSKGPEEVAGNPAGGLLVQLGEGELGGPVDRDRR